MTHDEGNRPIIDHICAMARHKLPAAEFAAAEPFIAAYYAAIDAEDLVTRPVEDLYGAVLAHWRLAQRRPPGTPLLRVYNPHYENHGWQSTHTVVEIVTDDMPFLVDSLSMELLRQDYTIHLIIHPVMCISRDAAGQLTGVLPNNEPQSDGQPEAVMRFEITRQTEEDALATLHRALAGVLSDVRAVVEDWKTMRARIGEIIATIEAQNPPVGADDKEEALHFLRWINNHHFTFIGFRTYDLLIEDGHDVLRRVPGSGLGILRDDNSGDASPGFAHIPAPLRAAAHQPSLLIITKSTSVSTVHRPVHLDYLGIKRFNNEGQVIGEWRLLGLFSSLAYSSRPSDIPILRKKVESVLNKSGFPPVSHGRKALAHILDTFPRDEMFQCTEQELHLVAMGIFQVEERHKLGLFLRKDLFGRFVTALVYVPRERYHTELRRRMQDILVQALNGESVEFNIQLSDSPLARVHFIIRTRPERIPEYDVAHLQARMAEAMLSWQDELRTALHDHFGEEQGARLFHRYGDAFSPAYRDDYSPRTAVLDIQHLEEINEATPFSLNLYHPPEQGNELLRFKVFGRDRPMTLTDVLPMLEQMGLRIISARPYEIEPRSGGPFWLLDFDMTTGHGINVEVLAVKDAFQETFAQVYSANIESDGFNRLVLAAGLHWRSVVMLRALCKYLLQTRSPFSQAYMEQSLAGNAAIGKLLVALFEARFNPAGQATAEARCAALTEQIETALEGVANLDEDRILRMFLALIQAMLRTNYYQSNDDGSPKPYLSFKFDPARVPTLPQPRPMFEIYVYSPRMEGVHLRGGVVARGGIRWSDRREDFRTEILGLMKAQMVKNAVIVPVGAKGGFVARRLPGGDDREAVQDEVVFCYRTFICGLLDLTDNLVDGKTVAPPKVVRYDRDDPYLVVAADKGTASFSDIANRIADEYGFWLGDAFASGGSTGYDHKKIGITARGAWESVKRHFRELGVDIQQQPFTAIGIGDMAGDVFGNGMLLSPQLRLVAAFNHQHIFIDPMPEPAASGFQERQRLFKLPRSAWSDYDPKLISAGGGVYSRRAKSISLSPQARTALGVDAARLTPNELIQAILRAPVDLLWNGGIGTFVKAEPENHADVGDRANDALRVNAAELRCKVVGEGGNLGFTQLARVEYAQRGGRINTDAIDNSGGVDCSDHEVNIKILLNQVVAGGDMTVKQRNQLLTDMTDEVAQLVLTDNYLQTQSLSASLSQSTFLLSDHTQLIRMLEKEGRLKRKLEFLPNDEEFARRETAQEGLTRPEIAILLAYSKIRLFEQLFDSDISEDPYLSHELVSYFPAAMREKFATYMESHPLRREIIATQITNDMVNRMGSTFWMRMENATGHSPAAIARAYTAAREIFGMRAVWREIESLDNRVSCKLQAEMLIETRRLLDRATLWVLRHMHTSLDIAAAVERYASHYRSIVERIARLLKDGERTAFKQRERQLIKVGIPKELSVQIAGLDVLVTVFDLTEIAIRTGTPILHAAEIYFMLSASLELYWLKEQIHALPRRDLWQRKARNGLLEELHGALRNLSQEVLEATSQIKGAEQRVDTWIQQNRAGVDHWQSLVTEVRASGKTDLAMLGVAMREIRALNGNQHA
ncbi:MAG: NAD-glutamate dehydrogenase [Gammaproteobacteria bacterium]